MQAIYEELSAVMDKGDEKAARGFIVKNLNRFPQADQDAIVIALFEEALAMDSRNTELTSEFQKQGLAVAAAIEKAKESLEKQATLVEIKEGI